VRTRCSSANGSLRIGGATADAATKALSSPITVLYDTFAGKRYISGYILQPILQHLRHHTLLHTGVAPKVVAFGEGSSQGNGNPTLSLCCKDMAKALEQISSHVCGHI
jgi:hypothetical protein